MHSLSRNNTLFLILLLGVCKTISSCCVNLTVAVLMERSQADLPFVINRTIGVINRGMAKAQEILKHSVNLNFIVRYADIPTCTSLKFGALAAEVYHNNEIHTIIGPGCSNAVATTARLTAAWDIPHITYGGTSEELGNKAEFKTLTRLSYNMNVFAKFYMDVFKEFSWTDIANIYDASSFLGTLAGKSLQKSFLEAGVKSHVMTFFSKASDVDNEILTVMNKAKTVSRVSCHGNFLRKIALVASHIGMERGDYTIIYFLSDPISGYIGNYDWQRGDEFDRDAKVAYESVLIIRPRRPTSSMFFELEENVKQEALSLYNFTWKEGSEMGIFNIAQYDTFIFYAHAIKDALAAGKDPRIGVSVVHQMWNRTFPGIGGMTFVNENGDRVIDFTLLDMDPSSGKFKVVAQLLGYVNTFERLPGVSIHWPYNGTVHPNKPPCGFTGELCSTFTFPTVGSITIGFTVVITLIVTLGVIYFRRMQAEAALQSEWWRVRWEDVQNQDKSLSASTYSKRSEVDSVSFVPTSTAFQTRAIYKGVTVHIRKPNIKFVNVDRNLLLELKKMRDVHCPNLTRLIGVCPDRNNVCILTEYCSRGTLQDILHNKSILLEKEFRISLVNDIVQGMYYLHTSSIGIHGYLTSANCLIDSRFVLKVTGFGLPSISSNCKDVIGTAGRDDSYNISDLLWIAPEILRNYPPRRVSQSGDVYSFAIILYEMTTRNEPYVSESWYQSVEDTVEQIKSEQRRPCQLLFDNNLFSELNKLITECWKENPEERPSFFEIRKTLQIMRRGNDQYKNVLDMLLNRMESYATNLEGLVEERTNAFLEEKKRSEELLYQVLPRSVADQLRSGQMVIPEEFKNVTIYFSDIVGFTVISATSTPFQVVDLLNDVYTCFDEIIENFTVYKVETIGDAYMVVSGLPIRNANEHVREIARMSLRILQQLQQFVIRHQPETPLQARIGIHSGPVVAGVVGRKMPRYCLFGDTVNTASRMESNGQPMKIHISDSTKQLLETFGNFVIEKRGFINIKGKGAMVTHWLIDEFQQAEYTDDEPKQRAQ